MSLLTSLNSGPNPTQARYAADIIKQLPTDQLQSYIIELRARFEQDAMQFPPLFSLPYTKMMLDTSEAELEIRKNRAL